nr:hypothetical protein [Tanacetum cinerariifolium]
MAGKGYKYKCFWALKWAIEWANMWVKTRPNTITHTNLYNALVKSYNTDKDILSTYGDVVTLKRGRYDQDKDEDPSAGSDRGMKRRKSSKDVEPSKGSKSKESKSSSSSKGTQSQPKFSGTCKSFIELEYHLEECYKAINDRLDWHNPEGRRYPFDLSKPLSLIEDQGCQVVPADYFINNDLKYLYLEEIVVRRDDNVLYKFRKGIIYQDKFQRNRLMRSDELYKFCDGMLSYVRTVLHDNAFSLEMDYLPKRHWSNLEKKRSHIMIKAMDKLLFERRLMRNLEKFVGGREYGNDLRLLEQTI